MQDNTADCNSSEPGQNCPAENQCGCLPADMRACINCRKAVEDSMTRIAGRKMRRLRRLPECSVTRCEEFLLSVEERGMRLHLASMAWWRFSSDAVPGAAEKIRRIMTSCVALPPDFGKAYMHRALAVLSPLTQEQLTAWFGVDNLFHLADLFCGGREETVGRHCAKCKLYKLGCTSYGMIGADACPHWNDRFLQDVAEAVRKRGAWDDPCRNVQMPKGNANA